MNASNGPMVVVAQTFLASPQKAYNAWVQPELLGQWMFGPNIREEEVIHLRTDPRVGGSFSFLVKRGDQLLDHVGEYLCCDPPRQLEFTWGIKGMGDETSRVSIHFKPVENFTELTLTHELHPKWADFAERTQAGWQKMFAALSKILATSSNAV